MGIADKVIWRRVDLEYLYAFEMWEAPGRYVDVLLKCVDGNHRKQVTRAEADGLVKLIYTLYPKWDRTTKENGGGNYTHEK
jgi:hypothetical protein